MGEQRFDVVFLDAGGVLVSPDPTAVCDHFAEAGFTVDPGRLFEAHYLGVRAIDDAQAAPEVFDDYLAAYVAHLGFGGPRRDEAAAVLADLWRRPGLWTEPVPGAADGLAAIAAADLAMVVVSNADGTVAGLLQRAGLLQVGPGPGIEVTAIIDSAVVGVAKPDPRVFEIALDAVGATADRAVHIGDAYQYDVRGARAAGVHPILVDPFGIRGDVDCDRITSLVDLVPLLAFAADRVGAARDDAPPG